METLVALSAFLFLVVIGPMLLLVAILSFIAWACEGID